MYERRAYAVPKSQVKVCYKALDRSPYDQAHDQAITAHGTRGDYFISSPGPARVSVCALSDLCADKSTSGGAISRIHCTGGSDSAQPPLRSRQG